LKRLSLERSLKDYIGLWGSKSSKVICKAAQVFGE